MDVEQRIRSVWATALGREAVHTEDNFFELGGDSLLAVEVVAELKSIGIEVPTQDFFENPTVGQLARIAVVRRQESRPFVPAGNVPLCPTQHWYFEQSPVEPHHWNVATLLNLCGPVDVSALVKAVQRLSHRHDALRLRFRHNENGWMQHLADCDIEAALRIMDFSQVSNADTRHVIEQAASNAQASLDLQNGPVFLVTLMNFGPTRPARLHITAHHLVCDGFSLQILVDELRVIYGAAAEDSQVELPDQATAFSEWSERLVDATQSGMFDLDMPFWADSLAPLASKLPRDLDSPVELAEAARTESGQLTAAASTSLLSGVPRRGWRAADVMLTAFGHSIRDWIDDDKFVVEVYRHGRQPILDGVDVTRTVGPFMDLVPVALTLDRSRTIDSLSWISTTMSRLPSGGLSFGALRYLTADDSIRARLAATAEPIVAFNYLGRGRFKSDSVFTPAQEWTGPHRSPKQERKVPLLVWSKFNTSGIFETDWLYSSTMHHPTTIKSLLGAYLDNLECLSTEVMANP